MDELIEILVRLIIGAFSGPKKSAPVVPISRAPMVVPPRTASANQTRSAPPQARRQGRRIAPPPILISAPIVTGTDPVSVEPVYLAPIPSTVAAAPATTVKPSANATVLRKWLTPATLKQQFMLTEILQAPIALRPFDPSK